MSFDIGKIVSELGEDLIAKAGEPAGLSKEQSLAVAQSLAAHFGEGKDEAVKQAAAASGVAEDAVASVLAKLIETGKDKLVNEGPVGDAIEAAKTQAATAFDSAKDQAMAAFAPGGDAGKAAGGFLSKLFGRK